MSRVKVTQGEEQSPKLHGAEFSETNIQAYFETISPTVFRRKNLNYLALGRMKYIVKIEKKKKRVGFEKLHRYLYFYFATS